MPQTSEKKTPEKTVLKAKAPKKTAAKVKKYAPKKKNVVDQTLQEVLTDAPKAAAKTAPAEKETVSRHYFYANGKRKTSIALVRLYSEGKGTITINERSFENYFPVFTDQDKILTPLRIANALKMFDISVRVAGGGVHSQAEAVRHGISKALLEYDGGLRTALKPSGLLTRDSRIKERKKYGLKRARRAPQWQKR